MVIAEPDSLYFDSLSIVPFRRRHHHSNSVLLAWIITLHGPYWTSLHVDRMPKVLAGIHSIAAQLLFDPEDLIELG